MASVMDTIYISLGLKTDDFTKSMNKAKENIEKTAQRKVGAASIKVNEQDLEATLTDIKSLFELEKECFIINFPQFVTEKQSDFPQSPATENATTKRGISVTPSAR